MCCEVDLISFCLFWGGRESDLNVSDHPVNLNVKDNLSKYKNQLSNHDFIFLF